MRPFEAGSRLQRATMWLVIALLAMVALLPADRVLVCLCPVDGMELALGRTAHTACHGVDGLLAGAPQGAVVTPTEDPLPACAHVELERAPWAPTAAVACEPPASLREVATEPCAVEPFPGARFARVALPPDPPPTALPLLRRCTVFLV